MSKSVQETQAPSDSEVHEHSFGAIEADPRLKVSLVVVLIGVSGSGKSTIGRRLARAMRCLFYAGVAEIFQRLTMNTPTSRYAF